MSERLASEARERYAHARSLALSLDMTRGKPCPEQLELSRGVLEAVDSDSFRDAAGTDCRNYGGLEGLPEARTLFAEILEVRPEEVLVGGNSSLELMHDLLVQALLLGVPGGAGPWRRSAEEPVRFLCPVPGYDRHFHILERFGIEMIPVAMSATGPDPDAVEELAASDPQVRGIFCVPRYSNPTGVTYGREVVERLATMKTAAPDFRIFWDNAYAVHHLVDDPEPLAPVLELCRQAGHAERVWLFTSTSKITYPGAGLAAVAASPANVEFIQRARSIQTIGPDKLNQLRHVRCFPDLGAVEAHMRLHAALLRPKFEIVLELLERRLAGLGVASWSRPRGGYFISLDTLPGGARRVVELAAAAGVKLTPAGATFPYGRDPQDRNLRLAPTLPAQGELARATELLADCIVLAAFESSPAAVRSS